MTEFVMKWPNVCMQGSQVIVSKLYHSFDRCYNSILYTVHTLVKCHRKWPSLFFTSTRLSEPVSVKM